MTDRHIRLDAAIEVVRNIPPEWARSGPLANSTMVTIKQAEAALSTLPAVGGCYGLPEIGAKGSYTREGMNISCQIISLVEGWLEVQFQADGSTCIVRPSSFTPLPAPPEIE